MTFEEWYEENAKYINPNDLYQWLSEAFDAGYFSDKRRRFPENHKTGLLDVLIEEVQQHEREACAKLVETTHAKGLQSIREACAAAIRARGVN